MRNEKGFCGYRGAAGTYLLMGVVVLAVLMYLIKDYSIFGFPAWAVPVLLATLGSVGWIAKELGVPMPWLK